MPSHLPIDELEALCGQTVGGRYVVDSVLGIGGMAAVLRAVRVDDGERMALKVLLPGEKDESFLRRFIREARLASRLRHPHIVRVDEVGRWSEGRLFIAMELVEGCSLHELLDAPLSVGAVSGIMVQILDALAFVHARGILHRDIKPDNVLIARRASGRLVVKLADFGIAAPLEEDGERLTQEGTLIGTPDFMAPEQVHGGGFVGPAADLYPIGIMLYRMLSGHDAFTGTPVQRLMARVSKEPPPLVPRTGLQVSASLIEVVAQFMARRVVDRFATAADGRAALLPFSSDPSIDDAAWLEVTDGRASTLPPEASLPTNRASDVLWARDEELDQLDRWAEVAEEGSARFVMVRGDVGIGKTTLVSEFALKAAEAGRFTLLRAAYQRAAGAEVGVRGAIERLLGTSGRDRAAVEETVQAFLEQQGLPSDDEVAGLVGFLRPAVGERLSRNESFARVVRLLRAMGRTRPVLIILDDLPEGGPDALAFLEHMMFEASYEAMPLMVLATLRPSSADRRFVEALDRIGRYEGSLLHSFTLGPLPAEELADALVRHFDLSPEAARKVVVRSAGNPLFARHLAEADDVELAVATGHSSTLTGADSLPDALRAILQQSLRERLAATGDVREAEDVLMQVAVLGEQVAVDLIEAMTGATASELDDLLDELIDHEVLVERGLDSVAFAHGLFREALLARLSARRLRRLHLAAAETRERVETGTMAAGAIGDHYAAGGKPAVAIEWWLRGVAYEAAAGDATEGSRIGRAALATMAGDDPRRDECALTVARLLRDLGEMREAGEVLAPLIDADSAKLALEAGELLAEVHQELGEGEAWSELVARLEVKHAEAGGDDHGAYHRALAFRLNHQGDAEGARAAAQVALDRSEPGPASLRAAIRLAWANKFVGDLDGARAAADRAAEEAGDDVELRAEALRMQLFTRVPVAGAEGTVPLAREALRLQRQSGRAARVVRGVCDLATALLMVGEPREALACFAEAESLAAKAAMRQVLGYIRLFTFVARLELDEHDGLTDEIELAKGRFVEVGSTGFVPLLELCAACASVAEGEVEQARACLERAGDLTRAPFSNEFARIMARLGLALREHEASGAGPVLEAAVRFLEERALHAEASTCRRALEGPAREP